MAPAGGEEEGRVRRLDAGEEGDVTVAKVLEGVGSKPCGRGSRRVGGLRGWEEEPSFSSGEESVQGVGMVVERRTGKGIPDVEPVPKSMGFFSGELNNYN